MKSARETSHSGVEAHLVLRIKSTLLGWGKPGRRDERLTELFPSKSSIVGMICNALGQERDDVLGIADVASLKMWAFCAKRGKPLVDFQTAKGTYHLLQAKRKDAVVMRRHYLSGAAFVVVLNGTVEQVIRYAEAIESPARILFLGKKAFLPSIPILAGAYEGKFNIEDSDHVKTVIRELGGKGDIGAVWDCAPHEANDILLDFPIRFDVATGSHRRRFVRREVVELD